MNEQQVKERDKDHKKQNTETISWAYRRMESKERNNTVRGGNVTLQKKIFPTKMYKFRSRPHTRNHSTFSSKLGCRRVAIIAAPATIPKGVV